MLLFFTSLLIISSFHAAFAQTVTGKPGGISSFNAALAQMVTIKPGGTFCFLKNAVPGDPDASKFGTKFQVFNGDTISVSMKDPSGNIIYSAKDKENDEFLLRASLTFFSQMKRPPRKPLCSLLPVRPRAALGKVRNCFLIIRELGSNSSGNKASNKPVGQCSG
jgi:hypothetical protein